MKRAREDIGVRVPFAGEPYPAIPRRRVEGGDAEYSECKRRRCAGVLLRSPIAGDSRRRILVLARKGTGHGLLSFWCTDW
eukprot:5739451-Prymnesium_polylepis.1